MSKFNLTKQMKAKLALELTVLAVKKNIPPIEKELKAIKQRFWDAHIKRVETETGISADKFPHLIQLGIISGTAFCTPSFVADGKVNMFVRVLQKNVFTGNRSLESELMDQKEIRGLSEYFHVSYHHIDKDKLLRFFFNAPHTVPRMSNMEDVTDQPELVEAINEVCDRVYKVFSAAADFHAQIEMILLPMRNSAQLLDTFPEAAKLLPEPVKVTHELAPIDQINRVREMLKSGVPPQPMGTC